MIFSYKKLWKLLIDKDMTKNDLQEFTKISSSTVAKLSETIGIIDTMKKSILARAFRGELGTNDPSDEDAREMLKRVL